MKTLLSFEIVPYEGKTLFLVDYVDLTHQPLVVYRRVIFEDLEKAKKFIATYLSHFGLWMSSKPCPVEKWIWSQVEGSENKF